MFEASFLVTLNLPSTTSSVALYQLVQGETTPLLKLPLSTRLLGLFIKSLTILILLVKE